MATTNIDSISDNQNLIIVGYFLLTPVQAVLLIDC